VLSVAGSRVTQRVDLIVAALAHTEPERAPDRGGRGAAGADGSRRPRRNQALADRVTFTGAIAERQLIDLYAGALAVVFPRSTEDFTASDRSKRFSRGSGDHHDRRRRAAGNSSTMASRGWCANQRPEALGGAIARPPPIRGARQSLGEAGLRTGARRSAGTASSIASWPGLIG